ncbi:MAG: BamA/TamA family outer membrane protein [bacterium]
MGKKIIILYFFAFVACLGATARAGPSEIPPVASSPEAEPEVPLSKKYRLSVFPIPVITSDPNEGSSFGAQANFFFRDSQNNVKMVAAPRILYNTLIGVQGGVTGIYYPSYDEKLVAGFGLAQRVYRSANAYYENFHYWHDRLYLKGYFSFLQDPFGRFWGEGNNTPKSAQTSYVGRNVAVEAEVGYYFLKHLRLSLRENFLYTKLKEGIVPGVANTINVFKPSDGVSDSVNWAPGLALVYDTRPRANLSTRGTLVDASLFFSLQALGSDNNFFGLQLDARHLLNFHDDRFVTVFRGVIRKVYGENLPFYQLSSLGGPNELRGYPGNRFIDKGKILLSLEQRNRIVNFKLFKTDLSFSLDPFFEVGEVFSRLDNFQFDRLRPTGGLGFRVLVLPSTLIRADVGFGAEGPNVFVKFDYPF